jgi:photosystem II stability/assembly factor-like uncharacterized protein
MKTLFRFLIAAICLFIQTYPAHAQWIQINAPGFLIGSLVASGSNLIAGAYSPGGVFVSSNRGVSWSRVDTLGLDLTTPAIAVDSNGVGGTDVFLIRGTRTFRSTDDGISWSVTGVLTPSAVFDLVALDRRLFIATIHGLFRSSDDGATWMPIPGPEYMAMQIAVSSNGMGGAKLFVGPYLRVSTDDGTTWTQMNTFGHATRSLFVSGRTVLAGLDHGVLRSTDNGISWAIANTSFLPSVDVFVAYESGKFLHPSLNMASGCLQMAGRVGRQSITDCRM